MSSEAIGVLSALKSSMKWLSARQEVLSQNVANASTPRYEAQDLEALDFGKILRAQDSGNTGHAQHASHFGRSGSMSKSEEIREIASPGTETSPDGNSVVLEEQMLKVTETQARYQAAINMYQKSAGMLRMALGRGR